MLTRKQSELLSFIERYIAEKGYAPSFEEMKVAARLRSKSGIHRLITGLEERGYIRRLHFKDRAIEVTRPKPLLDRRLLDRIIDAERTLCPHAAESLARVRIRIGALLIDQGGAA